MGSDSCCAIVKENGRLTRSVIADMVTDLWTKRGAKLVGSRWTKRALWKDDDQTCFAVAVSPVSKNGWVTLVESTEYSTSLDAKLLDGLAKQTTTWVSWSFDHSCIYGQRRLSRAVSNEEVDLGDSLEYGILSGKRGWSFFVFDGVEPMKFKRWNPDGVTKSDPWPVDSQAEQRRKLDDELSSCVTQLRVDRAIEIVKELGARVDDSTVNHVFDTRYPIQYPEPADGVTRIGLALADVRPLPADAWVRLLEVAAVQKNIALRDRAIEEVAKAKSKKDVAAAVAEAKERFAERKDKAATKRFVDWLVLHSHS